MTRNDLDQALGITPPEFSVRIHDTLRTLKEEPDMHLKHIRRALLVALILLLVVGVAVALVITRGQDWYYHNRFTAYEEYEPEKQEAILNHLTTDIPQEKSDTGVVSVTVQDASWAPQNGVATLSFSARPLHPDQDELHDMWDLDQDGSWSDTLDPEDPDSRTEHWLWVDKGYGLPADMMDDPAKRLLLFDSGDNQVFIGRVGTYALPGYSFDHFQGEDGAIINVLEFDLTQLDVAKVQAQFDAQTFDPEWGISEEAWKAGQAESLRVLTSYAQVASAAIAENTDKNGLLTLRYQYAVVPLENGQLLTGERVQGEVIFQIKIR